MSDYREATARLLAARGFETLHLQGVDDFQIKDIWGIFPFLSSSQSYYFVGSRGAGKSLLAAQTLKMHGNHSETLVCFLDGDALKSIGEGAEDETFRKFMFAFFNNLLRKIEERKNYSRIAKISSVYAGIKKWGDFRRPYQYMKAVTGERSDNSLAQAAKTFVKSHLRLDIASLKFSLVDFGVIRVGSVELKPLQLQFEASDGFEDKSYFDEVVETLNKNLGRIEDNLSELVKELARLCKEERIIKIVVVGDDFHYLSPAAQVRIIHFLRRVIGQLRSFGISVVVKIFSAMNLSPYIKGVLGLSRKELEVRNIESSLENLEVKRQAMEGLLLLILRRARLSDTEIRRLFRREIIDLILVLSGGHPRRLLEMCAKLTETTQGNWRNLYQYVMFSAATVLNEYRRELPIQLGIHADPRAGQYQRLYEKSIEQLSKNLGRDAPFFIIPYAALESHPSFAQWVEDAIAIGDLLEVVNLIQVDSREYRLTALNPATVHFSGQDLRISYQDIVNIQINARPVREEYIPQVRHR